MTVAAQTCERCGKPPTPYGAAVPTEHADSYCWGNSTVGIAYCLAHHGTRHEDEHGMCNWFDPSIKTNEEHPAECRFVELRYNHTDTPWVVKWEDE